MPRTDSVQFLRATSSTSLPAISAALTVGGFVALSTAAAFLLGPVSSEPARPWPTALGIAGGVSALAGLFLARWSGKQ